MTKKKTKKKKKNPPPLNRVQKAAAAPANEPEPGDEAELTPPADLSPEEQLNWLIARRNSNSTEISEIADGPVMDTEPEIVSVFTDEQVRHLIANVNREWVSASLRGVFTSTGPLGMVATWDVNLNWDEICDILTEKLSDPAYIHSISRGIVRMCPHPFAEGVYAQWTVALMSVYALFDWMRTI